LPQETYLQKFGTLKEQIIYPATLNENPITGLILKLFFFFLFELFLLFLIDQEARDILDLLGIGYLIDRELEEQEQSEENRQSQNHTWLDSKLSPGERQKLCFAKILYWKPQFACLFLYFLFFSLFFSFFLKKIFSLISISFG